MPVARIMSLLKNSLRHPLSEFGVRPMNNAFKAGTFLVS
jgi:hypothetical protein